MRAQEAFTLSNKPAGTYPFVVTGGRYRLSVKAATYGTVTLQQIMPDGSTAVSLYGQANSATPATQVNNLAANGCLDYLLPPGQYQLLISGGSAYYASIARTPLE